MRAQKRDEKACQESIAWTTHYTKTTQDETFKSATSWDQTNVTNAHRTALKRAPSSDQH